MVRKTTSEYIQQLEELYPGKYEVLSEYKTNETKIHIRFKKCGHEKWLTAFGVLNRGPDCQICKTSDIFFKRSNEKYKNKFEFFGTYVDNDTPIKVKCKTCGCIFEKNPHVITNCPTLECPVCGYCPSLFPYINDIWCTNPEIAKLLADPEDGHKYKANSSKKVWFICPDCGSKIFKQISEVTRIGKPVCNFCSDGISYPEKFMANVFKQLNITFSSQFSPKWAKPYYYDFMFKLNNIKYIVEMDGGIGHGNDKKNPWNTPEESQKIDNIKDANAKENGFIVIRIDCNYKRIEDRYNFIKNNILSSYLSKILDFSIVDFNQCELNSIKSTISEVAEIWNNGIVGIKNIQSKMIISKKTDTVCRYLEKACETGLIKESYSSVKEKNHKVAMECRNFKRKDIHTIKCIQTGEIFYGYMEPNAKYHAELRYYFSNKKKNKSTYTYGGYLDDGTKLEWIIINKESA